MIRRFGTHPLYELRTWRRRWVLRTSTPPVHRIAFNHLPGTAGGGGNQFVLHLSDDLRQQGYEVVYELDHLVDVIIIIHTDPRYGTFTVEDIRAFQHLHPAVIVIHRINECDARKRGVSHVG